jgi:hypothetical protein
LFQKIGSCDENGVQSIVRKVSLGSNYNKILGESKQAKDEHVLMFETILFVRCSKHFSALLRLARIPPCLIPATDGIPPQMRGFIKLALATEIFMFTVL